MGSLQRRLLIFVLTVVARPKLTLLLAALAVGGCALLAATRLSISSDQNKLFSPNVKFFRDYLDFNAKFPENEAIYIVVRPLDPDHPPAVKQWTAVADAITQKLSQMPVYVKSVDSRVPIDKLGPQGILFDSPDRVKQSIDDAKRFVPLVKLWAEKPTILTSLIGSSPLERFLTGVELAKADDETASFVGVLAQSWKTALEHPTEPLKPGEGLPDLESLDATDPSRLGYYYVPDETDHRHHQLLVRVYQQPNFTSLTAISEEVEAIRVGAKKAAGPFQEFTVGTTGRPALEADEMRTTDRDSTNAEIVALIVVFLGLVFMLKSVWLAFAAEIALAVGIGWTFGWATISVGELNLLSMVFLIALIGIGMDYLIQILVRYRREARRYVRPDAIWIRVFGNVSAPINTACLGAAGAFFVSVFTNFRGAAELGIIASGGLLLCLLAGYTVLPALLTLFPARLPLVEAADRYAGAQPTPGVFRRWIAPALWIAAILCGIPLAMRTKFDPGLLNLQAPNLESVKLVHSLQTWYAVELSSDLNVLRRAREAVHDLPTVDHTESVLNALDNQAWLDKPENQLPAISWSEPAPVKTSDLKAVAAHCRSLANHLNPSSASATLRDVGKLINDAGESSTVAERFSQWQVAFIGQLRNMLAKLDPPALDVNALPMELRGHYMSEAGVYPLYIYPKQDLWNRQNLAAFVHDVEGRVSQVNAAPAVTGIASNVYHSTAGIRRSFFKATLYAFMLIFALVFIDLRKLDETLMAISVLVLGLPMLIALMGYFGIDWNFANFFGLPILIGAGHEYGVFLVHRYKETLKHPRRVWRGWDVSDRALLLCAFVTSSSFGFFWALGHHEGLRSLGLVMAMGIACIYLAAVMVLQPLLKWRLARKLR